MLTVADRNHLDLEKQAINKAKKTDLYSVIKRLEDAIIQVRKDFGFRVSNSELVKILVMIERRPRGRAVRMNKSWLSQICTGYKKHWEIFDALPAHVMIQIDPGEFRNKRGELSWVWLEATVFEDLCALFNQAVEFDCRVNNQGNDKKIFKTRNSLLRATVLTAFHFVEAYLNGLAFDYYVSSKRTINEETESILSDWDPKRNKPRYLSLRDKVLQYPKIILGLEHPPLREDNCPELRYVVEHAKIMRDRFTHVSPKREFEHAKTLEQIEVYEISLPDVKQTVDSCIGLVRKVEKEIYGDARRLFWLHDRSPDGAFPDKVFD
jgi:hypothetical protein